MRNSVKKLIICMILLVIISTPFSLVSLSMQGINREVEDSSDSISDLSTQDVFWPTNSSEWTEVVPEDQGLDSAKISEMFGLIESSLYDVHSVIIVKNGYLITEEFLNGSQIRSEKTYEDGSILHHQASTTKSLMALLIGLAIGEGFLDNISQTLYEFFADIWSPSFANSTLKKNITIEQLLTMNSGLMGSYDSAYPGGSTVFTDCVEWVLDDVPIQFTPGEEGGFAYSNDGPNLLSGILNNATGLNASTFAQQYLFEPMGITEDEWDWWGDSNGVDFGGYGFSCSPKVQAKLGILCLNDGNWNGTQLIPSDWVINATSFKTSHGRWTYSPPTDIFNYGYLFYTNDTNDGYHTAGAGGQNIYVIPEHNMTVAFTGSDMTDTQYKNFIYNYIIISEDNGIGHSTKSWTGVELKTYTWETTEVNLSALQSMIPDLKLSAGASPRYYAFTQATASALADSGMKIEATITDIAYDQPTALYQGNISVITGDLTTEIGGVGDISGLTSLGELVDIANESNTDNLDQHLAMYYKYSSIFYTFPLDYMIPSGYGFAPFGYNLYLLFTANNTNWDYVLADWNSTLQAALTYGTDFTLEKSGNGFNVWYNIGATNPFLVPIWGDYNQKQTLEITFEYDNNGVLNYSSVSYGGVVAHTLEPKTASTPPSPTPGIPGYDLFYILGTSAIAGVVFIVKRRRLLKEI
ncbi:MAG: serine hydrolase domain-containing protein [Promethearchaeota archaeon]